jgi:2-iminoacetate synthase ThiH
MFKGIDIAALLATIGGIVAVIQTILNIILAKWPKLDKNTAGILSKLGKSDVTGVIRCANAVAAKSPEDRKAWAIAEIQKIAEKKGVAVNTSQLNSIIEWGVRTVKKSFGEK